jgi:hypothetical protein
MNLASFFSETCAFEVTVTAGSSKMESSSKEIRELNAAEEHALPVDKKVDFPVYGPRFIVEECCV